MTTFGTLYSGDPKQFEGVSSSGRKSDFQSDNAGSIPATPTNEPYFLDEFLERMNQ